MQGYLIVNHFLNTPKFRQLQQWILDSAKKYDVHLQIKTNQDLMIGSSLDKQLDFVDFVLFWDKDILLAKYLENKGKRVFNSSRAIELCDDKALTYLELLNKDISMPKTIIAPMTFFREGFPSIEFLDTVSSTLSFPIVIKERFGSFGEQVFLAHTKDELFQITASQKDNRLLFQEMIVSSYGKDLRLHVVGNKVVTSMLRTNHKNDFRANITVGGSMAAYEPTKEQEQMAIYTCRYLGLDFGGVDLLLGPNQEPILCEVNSNAHFINIYQCTGVNVADLILEYILDQCK